MKEKIEKTIEKIKDTSMTLINLSQTDQGNELPQ